MPKITAVGETTGTLPDGRHQPDEAERPLRVAIAGTGFIGEVHARAVRRAGARLVGVAASTPERGRAAARLLGAEDAFAHAEAMATSPDVDVVHVCTPNHLHAGLAEAALAAGKHVVCEKPLADRRRAPPAASPRRPPPSGRVATVPFVYRFYPLVREARARVAAGAIGPVRLLHGSYLQDWLATEEDDNWRVDADLAGASRAFADIGSHWCDLVEFVSGDRLAAVCAEAVTAVPERVPRSGTEPSRLRATPVDRRGRAAGPSPPRTSRSCCSGPGGGVAGSVVISQVSPGRKNRLQFEVAGVGGHAQLRPGAARVAVGRPAGVVRDGGPRRRPPRRRRPRRTRCCRPGTHRATRTASTPSWPTPTGPSAPATPGAVDGLPTFADGARAADITDAVLRSAKGRTWEEVPPS